MGIDSRINEDEKEIHQARERKKRIEAVSCELMEICAENDLTIAEMLELSHVLPILIKEQVKKMQQNTKFTMNNVQDYQE